MAEKCEQCRTTKNLTTYNLGTYCSKCSTDFCDNCEEPFAEGSFCTKCNKFICSYCGLKTLDGIWMCFSCGEEYDDWIRSENFTCPECKGKEMLYIINPLANKKNQIYKCYNCKIELKEKEA